MSSHGCGEWGFVGRLIGKSVALLRSAARLWRRARGAAAADRAGLARLEELRDEIDMGETLEKLELSSEPLPVLAGLLRLFFLELPGPLLLAMDKFLLFILSLLQLIP